MLIPERRSERGEVNMFLVTTVIFVVLAIGLGVGFGWAYMSMLDYKDNSDQKVAAAVETAKTEQKETDQKQFDEDYKKPNNTFTGPANYGSVSFDYPKTWSVYVHNDGSVGNEYMAYFYPGMVPPVKTTTPYSLRVSIVSLSVEQVLKTYESKVKLGELKSTAVNLADASEDPNDTYGKGTRLDGQFDQTINGSAVFFDVRGRTLKIFMDHSDFAGDFNDTILKTLKYRN